jgi:WD40 repeat protein
MAHYETVGGVVGALRRRADRLVDELDRRGEGRLVMPTLLKLAAVEGDSEPTRRRVLRSALGEDEQTVVDAFLDARLLTSTKNADGLATIEVAHEALLRQWQPLREAIVGARTSLRMRSELERLAVDWDQGQQDESYLLRGGRLANFDKWAAEHGADIGPLERQFIEASRAVKRKAAFWGRVGRGVVATISILLVLALVAGVIAVYQRDEASRQVRLAVSGQMAAQANRLVDTQPDTAILAGLQSLSLGGSEFEPPSGLVSGLARVTHASRTLTGHTGPVKGVAFSRNGQLAATASGDRSARLWETATGHLHGQPLTGHTGGVLGVAFSPNGRLLATASQDGTARLWEVATGQPHGQPLTGHTLGVSGVAFSPNGRLLATASQDGTARLWEVATGQPHGQPLTGHTDTINSVSFGQKGRLLATASDDRTMRLWDIPSGQPRGQPLIGHTDRINAVALSPDDQFVISGSTDQTARLWEVAETPSISQPLIGHTDKVNAVAFRPDGRLLATASDDQTVRLWDVATGQPHGRPLIVNTGPVTRVAFSRDGQLLATASQDIAQLWDLASGEPQGGPLVGHTDKVKAVAFSTDGSLLVLPAMIKRYAYGMLPLANPTGGRSLATQTG